MFVRAPGRACFMRNIRQPPPPGHHVNRWQPSAPPPRTAHTPLPGVEAEIRRPKAQSPANRKLKTENCFCVNLRSDLWSPSATCDMISATTLPETFRFMGRKLFAALLTLAFIGSLLPSDAAAQRRRRPARRPPAGPTASASNTRAQDARVAQLGEAYLRGHYAFNPTEATTAGLHEFDSQLEARSAADVEREARRLRGVLADLARVVEWRLSPEARYDYLVLSSHARAQ